MPDINEYEIFKNDIDRDNEAIKSKLSQGLTAPTVQASSSFDVPQLGSFNDGRYTSQKNTLLSLDDIGALSLQKYDQRDVQDAYDPYVNIDKDYNSTFDNYEEKKYIKGKFGLDVTKSLQENEQKYFDDWQQQNPITKTLKTVGTFATNTVAKAGLKFMEGLGFLGSGIVNTVTQPDDYFLKVADNGFSKYFEGLEQGLKDDSWTRTFHDSNYGDLGFFSKMGTSEFWGSEAADGVAFMLSAMVPVGGIAGRIGKGLGLAATVGEEAAGFGRGLQFAGRLGEASEAVFGSKSVQAPIQWAYSVASESFFEAKGVADDLDQRRKDPNDPLYSKSESEYQDYKNEKAKNTFLGNVALLSATNLFQNRLLFKALGANGDDAARIAFDQTGKAVAREYTNGLSRFFNNTRFGKSIYALGEGTLMEGYIEENAQLAIERINASNDQQYLHYDPNSSGFSQFIQQLVGQTKQASTLFGGSGDTELSTSIGLGGLMGGGMAVSSLNVQKRKYNTDGSSYTGRGGYFYGEVNNERDHNNIQLADLQNRYKTWQDASQVADLKSRYTDLQQQLDRAQTPEQKQGIEEELNDVSKQFLATTLATQAKLKGLSEQTIIAEELEKTRPIEASILKRQAFTDYFIGANNSGLGESLLESLKGTKDLSTEDLKQFGLDPKTFNTDDYDSLVKIGQTILDSSKDTNLNLEGFRRGANLFTTEALTILNTNRKNRVLNHALNSRIYQDAADKYSNLIQDGQYHSSEVSELNTLQEGFAKYRSLQDSISQNQQLIDSGTLTPSQVRYRKSKVNKAKQQLSELQKNSTYSVINWDEVVKVDTKDFSITDLSKVLPLLNVDQVGLLQIDPNLSPAEQEKAKKDYIKTLNEETQSFYSAIQNNLINQALSTSYQDAKDFHAQEAERLRKMNAKEFQAYFDEQVKQDQKVEEQTQQAENSTQPEAQASSTAATPVVKSSTWTTEESDGTYRIKDQDGNHYQQDGKDFSTTDEDIARTTAQDLNSPKPIAQPIQSEPVVIPEVPASVEPVQQTPVPVVEPSPVVNEPTAEPEPRDKEQEEPQSIPEPAPVASSINTNPSIQTPTFYLKEAGAILNEPDPTKQVQMAQQFLTDIHIVKGKNIPEGLKNFLNQPTFKALLDRLRSIVLIDLSKTDPDLFMDSVYAARRDNELPSNPQLDAIIAKIEQGNQLEEQPQPTPEVPEALEVEPQDDPIPALAIYSSNKTTIRNTQKDGNKDRTARINSVDATYLTENRHTLFMQDALPEVYQLLQQPESSYELVALKDRLDEDWKDNFRYDDMEAAARNLGIVMALVKKGSNTPVRISRNADNDLRIRQYSDDSKNDYLATFQIDKDAFSIRLQDKYDAVRNRMQDQSLTNDQIRDTVFRLNDKNEILDRLRAKALLNSGTERIVVTLRELSRGLQQRNSTQVSDLLGTKDFSIELLPKGSKNTLQGEMSIRLKKSQDSSIPVYPSTISQDENNGNSQVYNSLKDVLSQKHSKQNLDVLIPILQKLLYLNRVRGEGYNTDILYPKSDYTLNVKDGKVFITDRQNQHVRFSSLRINPLLSYFKEGEQMSIPQLVNGAIQTFQADPQQYFQNSVYTYYRPVTKDGTTLEPDTIQQYIYFDYNFPTDTQSGINITDSTETIPEQVQQEVTDPDLKNKVEDIERRRQEELMQYPVNGEVEFTPTEFDRTVDAVAYIAEKVGGNGRVKGKVIGKDGGYQILVKDGPFSGSITVYGIEGIRERNLIRINPKPYDKSQYQYGYADIHNRYDDELMAAGVPRFFPVQDDSKGIPEQLALVVFENYQKNYPNQQSLEDIRRRGGFSTYEVQKYSQPSQQPVQNDPQGQEELEQVIQQEEKKQPKRKRQTVDDLLDDLGTRARVAPSNQSLVSNPQELVTAKRYFKERFPQVPVEIIDGFVKLQDSKENALGLFSKSLIKLSSLADRETAYHEAFHTAFNLFLTNRQQEDILNEASQLYGIPRNSTQSTANTFQSLEQGADYYNQQTNDVQLEERLAFEFQKLRRDSTNLSLSDKLRKWLTDLWNKLKAFLTGKENIQNLYRKIESGAFSKAQPNYTSNDATRLSIYDNKGDQVMSLPKAEYYVFMVNGYLYNIFGSNRAKTATKGQITINDLKNPQSATKIYDFVKNQLTYRQEDSEDPTIQRELQTVLDNWEAFRTYHLNSVLNAKLPTDDEERIGDEQDEDAQSETNIPNSEEDDENPLKQMKAFDKAGNDSSTYEAMSIKLKSIFSILPKMEKNPDYDGSNDPYVPSQDSNGVNLPVDTQNLIDYIASTMSGERNDERFFTRLFSPESFEKVPELYAVQKLLPIWNKDNPSMDEALIVTEFLRVFNKPRANLYSIVTETDNDGNTTTQAKRAAVNNRFKIQDRWISNWQVNSIGVTKETLPDDKEVYYRNDKEVSKDTIPGYQTMVDGVRYFLDYKNDLNSNDIDSVQFLKDMGIVISPLAIEERNEDIRNIAKDLRTRFSQPVENPIDFIRNGKDKPARALYQQLLSIEQQYSTLSPTLGVTNAEGEARYDIQEWNTLADYQYKMNRAQSLDELYELMPQLNANKRFEQSFTYRYLFNAQGKKIPNRSLYMRNYSEFVKVQGGAKTAQSTNKLSPMDKLIMDTQALLGTRMVDIPRNEAKQSFFSVGIETDKTINPHFFQADSFQTGFDNKVLHDYIKDIYAVTSDKGPQSMFSFLNGEPLTDQAINQYFEKGLADLKNRILTNVGTIQEFQQQVGEHIFQQQGRQIGDKTSNNLLEASLRTMVVNKFLNDTEYFLTIAGPLESYASPIKRLPAWTSTGTGVEPLTITKNYVSNNSDLRLGTSDTTAPTMSVNIVENKVSAKNSKEHVDFMNSILDNFTNQKEREELRTVLENDVDVADGQGYINLDFYKSFLLNAGRWNDEMQVAHDFEVLTYKKYKGTITDVQTKELQRLTKLVYSQGAHNFALPVLKFQYAGFIEGTDKPAFHKFSLAPQLPSVILGRSKQLTQEMENQIEKGIAYTTHASGSKVKNAGINQIGKSDILTRLNVDGLKEQLKTDNHQKESVITGSQFRKLLFNALYGFQKSPAPELDALNKQFLSLQTQLINLAKEKLYKKLGVDVQENNGNATLYVKDFSKLAKILQEEATKKGMNTNVKDALSVDPDGKLRNQFETTGMASPVLDLLFGLIDKTVRVQKTNGNQMVQYSNAYYDKLDFYKMSKDKTKIEKAGVRMSLTSEFRKLLNAQHQDGDRIDTIERLNESLKNPEWVKKHEQSLTVVAYRIPTQSQNSMEFLLVKEFLPPTSGNIIQLYDQITLKSGADFDIDKLFVLYPSLTEGGAFLDEQYIDDTSASHQKDVDDIRQELKDFYQPFMKKGYSKLDRNLELINTEDLDSDLFESVENFTNAIFDNTEDDLAELKQESLNRINPLLTRIRELRDRKKNALQNKLLQTYVDILSHPSQFKALVTPNNTTSLFTNVARHVREQRTFQGKNPTQAEIDELDTKPLTAKDLKVALPKGSDVLSYATGGLDMYKLLMGQKNLLGVAAKQNTLFSQVQQGDFNVYTKQNITTKDKKTLTVQRTYFPLRFRDNEKFIQENPSFVPLNKGTDPQGNSVNATNDQMVTGFVDAPSNAMLGESGIDFNNINIFYYLRWTGHSEEQILDFLNLPVLKNFYLLKNKSLTNGDAYFQLIKRYDPEGAKGLTIDDAIEGKEDIVNSKEVDKYLNEKLWKYQYYTPKEIKLQKLASKDQQSPEFNLQMLANFRHFQIMTSELGGYTADKNFDTHKVSSHFTAQQRIDSIEKYKQNPILTPQSILDFEQTLPYLFDNDQSIVQMVRNTLPIFGSEEITTQMVKDMFGSRFRRLSQSLQKTYPKVLLQDFINAIIQTYGTYNGQNLQAIGDSYILDKQNSFYHDFRQLVTDNPELYKELQKNYTIIDNIFFESDGKFKILIDNQNKDVVADTYINELQSLIHHEDKTVRDLFTKFTIAAFKMGGFSKNRYNITQMLPLEVLTPIFKDAVATFDNLSAKTKQADIGKFKTRFNTYNPKFNPDAKAKRTFDNKNYNLKVTPEEMKDQKVLKALSVAKDLKTVNTILQNFILNAGLDAKDYQPNVEAARQRITQTANNPTLPSTQTQEDVQPVSTEPDTATDGEVPEDYQGISQEIGETYFGEVEEYDELGGELITDNQNFMTTLSDFTNYSGAAEGSDTEWEQVGKRLGVGKQVNYKVDTLKRLTPTQMEEVEDAYRNAVIDLGRKALAADTYAGGLVRRDYLQAKAADAVFAISAIVEPNRKDKKGYTNRTNHQVVEGGTGYAVQMAINLNKPVFVFDQNKNQWFRWDGSSFVQTETPTLTQKFAGIGTREINDNGRRAIQDVYQNTIKDQDKLDC